MKAKILLILLLFTGLSTFSQPSETSPIPVKEYQIEKVFPNPIADYLFVQVEAADYASARFELVDILGNTIQQWEPKRIVPGSQQIKLTIKDIHTGIYLLKAKIGAEKMVIRIRKV